MYIAMFLVIVQGYTPLFQSHHKVFATLGECQSQVEQSVTNLSQAIPDEVEIYVAGQCLEIKGNQLASWEKAGNPNSLNPTSPPLLVRPENKPNI
jgi:hypothetical protein